VRVHSKCGVKHAVLFQSAKPSAKVKPAQTHIGILMEKLPQVAGIPAEVSTAEYTLIFSHVDGVVLAAEYLHCQMYMHILYYTVIRRTGLTLISISQT
jgi:hypothetical protein